MEEIINSVMQSPENTNPNVLRSQLQSIGGSSGGGIEDIGIATSEAGFELTEEMTIAEVYNRVVNGARFCVNVEGPGVSTKYYLRVQSAVRVDSPERYVIEIRPLNSQSLPPLYLYNEVGSDEVVISEHAPGN